MKKLSILLLLSGMLSLPAQAAQDFSDVSIIADKVAGDVYMLQGAGGNIGVLATDEGLLLVDDQFEPLAEKIETAMKEIKDQPLKYVVNTHYHGDHTGANAYFAQHAPIFAHENVRKRVAEDNKKTGAHLPVVTYKDGVKIYLDDEVIELMHLPSGHTDGDTVVYFSKHKVLHMGDLFFEGRFPYIDITHGGTVKGYLANIKKIRESYAQDIKIIPGHGKLTDMIGLQSFIEMITYSIDLVETALEEGKTEEEILKAGIGEQYKDWSWQFINEERWLKTLITDLGK
ncbi:MBL fold metallo-hydrolase [Thalassotalea sp. PS06]|uniref:MBL fold metallo-hydrolase n=1 Tax=Thalassotalea sp. PS06 TaxID=2594005 RepID=UPI001163D99D|nr:MBL fold metallo-hydrolase [Thalassotalea sp. PS06]QDP00721.1 MBL fold metallo-hydrolase [Thalassotalea sp. PS06]